MKKKKKELTDEQIIKRRDVAFQRKIKTIFVNAGFEHLNTRNEETTIGNRVMEIDSVYFYENILLICEDTGATNDIKKHIRNKNEVFDEIAKNKKQFLEWLVDCFPDYEEKLKKYDEKEYKFFNLYFYQFELNLTADELSMYSNIKFVDIKSLNYFHRMYQCIRLSSRYEIFRFLGLKKSDIGLVTNEGSKKTLQAPIIYPEKTTGINNGIRVVSFMMSAESLLNTCYVLRKDNWQDSIWLYQRLIEKEKIKKIRNFLAKKGESFYNNIIVALPNNVRFKDLEGNSITVDKIGDFEKCELEIPDEWNSICVIDGQHRIFAHYEGNANDKSEKRIADLRKQLHLLVTGLIFPSEMSNIEKTKIQGEIFLDINSNSKPVKTDILLHIEMLKNPYSDIGLARQVIERLNKERPFQNMFEMSSLDTKKIKIASIIKFALRYLVTTNPLNNKQSFYLYWNGDKEAFANQDERALEDYLNFCSKSLCLYFSAIKTNFLEYWKNPDSKLLSAISINGFIIAYTRQLKANGIKDIDFYNSKLSKLEINFSKEKFMYTSSQYRKLSDEIIEKAFDIKTDD
jgi:DGQHR domain-containing protein